MTNLFFLSESNGIWNMKLRKAYFKWDIWTFSTWKMHAEDHWGFRGRKLLVILQYHHHIQNFIRKTWMEVNLRKSDLC